VVELDYEELLAIECFLGCLGFIFELHFEETYIVLYLDYFSGQTCHHLVPFPHESIHNYQ